MVLLNVNPAVAFSVDPPSLNCTCVSTPPGVEEAGAADQKGPPVELEYKIWPVVPLAPFA